CAHSSVAFVRPFVPARHCSSNSWPCGISSKCWNGLVLLAHHRQRILHVAVTAHPTAAWTAQQLPEAFPDDSAPAFLLRDRADAFAATLRPVPPLLTPPPTVWTGQNPGRGTKIPKGGAPAAPAPARARARRCPHW